MVPGGLTGRAALGHPVMALWDIDCVGDVDCLDGVDGLAKVTKATKTVTSPHAPGVTDYRRQY